MIKNFRGSLELSAGRESEFGAATTGERLAFSLHILSSSSSLLI